MQLMMNNENALAILEWYAEMGVDEAIADVPLDYRVLKKVSVPILKHESTRTFYQSNIASASASSSIPPLQALSHTPLTSPSVAIAEAKALASDADTLEALTKAIAAFNGCALKKAAMHTVIADGNPHGNILIIGDKPEEDDDRNGIAFCGNNGVLLDAMFASIGFTRAEHLHLTNMVFWRPPGKRTPTPEEIAISKPFVEKRIVLVNPTVIVLMGTIATTHLLRLPTSMNMTKLRGKTHHYTCDALARDIPVMTMMPPQFLFDHPAQKKQAWNDLLNLRTLMIN